MSVGLTPERIGRSRLRIADELLLVALPTVTMLLVFGLVEAVTKQRLLFASLASSAFLIYLDPEHSTNQVKTLVIAQLTAAFIGYGALRLLGPGYAAAAVAMVVLITILVGIDRLHPPAISTSLAFAFQSTKDSNLLMFALGVGATAVLVALERGSLALLRRTRRRRESRS